MFNFRFTWPSFPFTYNLLSTIWTNQVHPELIWTVYTWTWSFPSLKKFSTWIWPLQCVVPYKGIQDSLGFWIPRLVFRILGTGFQYLSVKLGFWILIVRAIPDSLSGIPDSQPRIPDSTFKFFFGFRVPQAKKWGEVFRKHSSKSLYWANISEGSRL